MTISGYSTLPLIQNILKLSQKCFNATIICNFKLDPLLARIKAIHLAYSQTGPGRILSSGIFDGWKVMLEFFGKLR